MLDEDLGAFLSVDCAKRDTMHDLTHVRRIRDAAQQLAVETGLNHDPEALRLGAYLHGIVCEPEREQTARRFLLKSGVGPATVERAVQAAHESQADAQPETPEGVLLHDGHLTEGGRSFLLVKSLVTGAARGDSLAEIVLFWSRHMGGRQCCLPQAQARYDEQMAFARAVFDELTSALHLTAACSDGPST